MISQREARRLMKRVAFLEGVIYNQRNRWSNSYIGTEIARVSLENYPAIVASVDTARKLTHAVVAVSDNNVIRFVALPHSKADIE